MINVQMITMSVSLRILHDFEWNLNSDDRMAIDQNDDDQDVSDEVKQEVDEEGDVMMNKVSKAIGLKTTVLQNEKKKKRLKALVTATSCFGSVFGSVRRNKDRFPLNVSYLVFTFFVI